MMSQRDLHYHSGFLPHLWSLVLRRRKPFGHLWGECTWPSRRQRVKRDDRKLRREWVLIATLKSGQEVGPPALWRNQRCLPESCSTATSPGQCTLDCSQTSPKMKLIVLMICRVVQYKEVSYSIGTLYKSLKVMQTIDKDWFCIAVGGSQICQHSRLFLKW